jgi:hypothetical protein
MRTLMVATLSSFVALGVLTPTLSARLLENWPYDRLFKEADLVVIARATSTEDCDDKTSDNPWKEEFLGLNTAFSVETVLKGKCKGDKLTVLHFKVRDEVRIANGPLLVSFRTKGTEIVLKGGTKVGLGAPEYILFLKATKDGRFEPVSGRTDPRLSVKEVHSPLSNLYDDDKKK